MILNRRAFMGGLAAIPAAALAQDSRAYVIDPVQVGDGIWIVRGADEAIAPSNGGAIANIAIIDTPKGTVLCDCGPSALYARTLKATAQALTGKPIVRVYVTHLHPDHGLGIGAFDPGIVAALPGTIADIKRDGQGFSDAMYRILADWMLGTDLAVPGVAIQAGEEDFGGRTLKLLSLKGHSDADLAIVDVQSGILIGGDLLFHNRAPATPNANLAAWKTSLDALAATPHGAAIPGHGPFDPSGKESIDQTRDWISWLGDAMKSAVASGLDMVEAGEIAIPERFAGMAAARYELQRSVVHFYPALEQELTLPKPVRIHWTGCPNSCGQPQVADIGLMGAKARKDGRMVEGVDRSEEHTSELQSH